MIDDDDDADDDGAGGDGDGDETAHSDHANDSDRGY